MHPHPERLLPSRLPTRDEVAWALMPVVAAVCLLTLDRFGLQARFVQRFGASLLEQGVEPRRIRFLSQLWASGWVLALLVAVPSAYLAWAARKGPWGLRLPRGEGRWPKYFGILALMLPVLWVVAGTSGFRDFYPLFDPPTLGLFVLYEAVYLTQFLGVEYFFRGPLLLRLAERFGMASIGMMVVPYAMMHVYKPFPEALGSVVAGLLLGYLALRARSIWPGVMLHCGVALSMDLFALARSGRLEALLG